MPAQRMIPGIAERNDDSAVRFQKPGHLRQNSFGMVEVLERIDGKNDVRPFVGPPREFAVGQAAARQILARGRKRSFEHFDPDGARRAETSDIDRLFPWPQPKSMTVLPRILSQN